MICVSIANKSHPANAAECICSPPFLQDMVHVPPKAQMHVLTNSNPGLSVMLGLPSDVASERSPRADVLDS